MYYSCKVLKIFFILFLFFNVNAFCLVEDAPVRKTFYVATNGNDQWSGTLPSSTESKKDGPFATLERARNAVRDLRQDYPKGAYSIEVRGGIYRLEKTFILESEDSGTEEFPLIISAFGSESPILTGTRIINNFEPFSGEIHKASLAGLINDFFPVRQLFVNNKRQALARYPNTNHDIARDDFLYVEMPSPSASKREFVYHAGSIPKYNSVVGAEIDIFPGSNWANDVQILAAIDDKSRTVRLNKDISYDIMAGNRFHIQNFYEALDAPTEWYFDYKSKNLYFWPTNKTSLSDVSIPIINSIIEIRGKSLSNRYLKMPSNIKIEGLTLQGCNGTAVLVKGAVKTVIAGNTIYNAGIDGIEIEDGSRNEAIDNNVSYVGRIGIKISGGDQKTLTPAYHRVENNHIHDVGIFNKGQSAILCKGVGQIISHNLIHTVPRIGIWFDGNDHLIEYNHIFNVNTETEDSGIIYSS